MNLFSFFIRKLICRKSYTYTVFRLIVSITIKPLHLVTSNISLPRRCLSSAVNIQRRSFPAAAPINCHHHNKRKRSKRPANLSKSTRLCTLGRTMIIIRNITNIIKTFTITIHNPAPLVLYSHHFYISPNILNPHFLINTNPSLIYSLEINIFQPLHSNSTLLKPLGRASIHKIFTVGRQYIFWGYWSVQVVLVMYYSGCKSHPE